MIKCNIDDKALKSIQSRTAIILREYLKNKLPIIDLKIKVLSFLDKIANQYELTDINSIVDIIYKTSIRYGVVDRDSEFFSRLNITSLLNASLSGVQINNSQLYSTDNLTDTEAVKLRYDASREFIDNSYGMAREVSTYALNTANKNIFDCLFINRGSVDLDLGIVSSNADLNRNIRRYLEALLQKITTYLRLVVKNAPNLHTSKDIKDLLDNPKLYLDSEEDIVNTGILEKISLLTNMYLSPTNFNADVLRQLYNDMNNSTLSLAERDLAKQKLDAYNAKVLLDHFDTYLSIILGKAIKIKDFNRKTGENKYQISESTANLATTWRVSDNIFVEDEADMITKLAINTTPLIRWQSSVAVDGKYINFQDFEHIIAKIKDLVYNDFSIDMVFNDAFKYDNSNIWDSLSEDTKSFLDGKRLSTAISMIRRNPRQYIHSIFELLTNNDFYDLYSNSIYSNFTKDELNKLYSISRGIFNGNDSIYLLAGHTTGNDYYSYITLTVDAIFSINYLLYYKDSDGVIQVRTLMDLSVNNIRRNIEQTINTGNSRRLIKNFNLHIKYLDIKPNSTEDFKSITYIIPNTNIRAYIVASSGSVTFYDNSTNQKITNFMELWLNDDIKTFIDNMLHLNLANNTDLQEELYDIYKSWSNLCNDLLSFSSRVILNLYVSNEILKDKSKDLLEALINKIYGRNAPIYNYALDELGLIHGNDVPLLKKIAIAKANLFGITTASQVKDGAGNSLSMHTLSRLLGSLQSLFEMQERLPWSASKDFLILNVPGLYEGVYTAKEFYDLTGDTKESTDMSVSEISYAGIVHDFIKGFIYKKDDTDLVGSGHVLFIPSVNSDKSTIGRIRINLNKTIEINGELKAIKDLNSSELEQVIAKEFGKFYTNMYNAITSDWKVLDEFLKLKGINLSTSLASDFINGFSNFNSEFLLRKSEFSTYGETPTDFIKYFVLKYNKSHRLHPLELIDLVHYKSNKKGNKKGNLEINETIIALIAKFNPDFIANPEILEKYPTLKEFWNIKKALILKTLIKSDFSINTTNVKLPELKHIREKFPNWINSSGDMILAKVIIDGKEVNITSARDIIRISKLNINDFIDSVTNTLTLNPIIELYNYLDYLFTLEFMNSTVGSFVAHPPKGKITTVLELEAALFQALHKRNVSFTASMHPFLLNLLNGIPEYYNIAVIDDINDEQGTITGLINLIKPFDGATFVNPFVVILENNSLGGAKAGITKKLFVHFKNERTGTGGIIKTAGFGLTNDWIRNSPFLERMMLKMTDHIWLELDGSEAEVDITTNFRKNPIKYKDFFFKQNGKYYKILDIKKAKLPNTYERYIQEVNLDGSIASNPDGSPASIIKEGPITINTNYKLWNFFGGKNSMKMDGKFLKLSNTSVENVVIAMNNIGTKIGNSSEISTLDQLWLPLKLSDVHYVATAGAVKQGAANINSASKYYDDLAYDTLRIKMYQAGIQLDKEHHADDSELSLMTLVISACASKGYTFEAATKLYETLRKATEIGTKDHLLAVKLYFNDEQSKEKFLEVLMKSIIDALSSKQNANNFALIIASDLIRLAKEGKTIKFSEVSLPLSDNTVYAKLASTIASYLTNTGIKLKIPGLLSVLTPSHEVFKIYAGRKYESFTNPELELAELLRQQLPVYLLVDSQEVLELSNALHYPETSYDEGTPEYQEASERTNLILSKYSLDLLTEEEMNDLYENGWLDLPQRLINLVTKIKKDNTISNLELGRNYFITRIAITEVEDADGNLVKTEVPYVESKLIRTPSEYLQLKRDISAGNVILVVENILEGRNLAGYNVRFISDTTGERFLLWDLDSAATLFKLNELKDKWTNSVQDIKELLGLYEELFNVSPILNPSNTAQYLLQLEIRLRRMLLNDLENLSHSTLDTKKLYLQLLSTKLDDPRWYRLYAQWVNIKLGRKDGSNLFIRGKYVQVTSENFREIEQIVARILDNTTKVRINKEYHTIDKSSIVTLAYEIIMPKTFATAFGLLEFDDLETIKNDLDFFVKRYLLNLATKVSNNEYSIEFKVANGNHYYLLTKKLIRNTKLTKVAPLTVYLDGKTYRLDSDLNIMYEITPDTEIYQDKLGNEVIVSDDLEFYINNLLYDSIKLSDSLVTAPSLVRTITDLFKKSSNKVANSFYRYITSLGNLPKDVLRMNTDYHLINLDNYLLFGPTHPIVRQGRNKHTSLLKSLDIVAARIPALSMLSYMPMKVVAYDNPDINTAYVSTYQILLLGSDYDIDAVSLATYDISNNGILELWSPYANISTIELMNASMELPIPSGIKTEIPKSANLSTPILFLTKYRDILNISLSMIYNKETKEYELNTSDIELSVTLDTVDKIKLFSLLLEDVKDLTKPETNQISQLLQLAYQLMTTNIIGFLVSNPMLIIALFNKLENLVNKHNLYFDKLSKYNLDKVVNNYSLYSMYKTACDAVNLILALTSVDGTTGPLKDVADESSESKEAITRTPGNVFNKFLSIVENLVGKQGIGICAVGLKAFFGLTLYNNYILNRGTAELQLRLLLGNQHRGHLIGGNIYRTLANIRSKDPNTITNADVLEALSLVNNDNDAALVLSALLSLATDSQ